MSATLSPVPKLQFFDANGAPLAGGKLYSYIAGTTTPQSTYTDSTGATANANPVILDSRGEAGVWLANDAFYKLSLYTADNVLVWTVDQIASNTTLAALAASGGSALVGFIQSGTGAVATTVQTKLRESVSVLDFGAVGDGVADDTAEIQAAIDAVNAAGGGTVLFPTGTYKVTSTLTAKADVRLLGSVGFQSSPISIVATHSANIISVPITATQFVIEGLAFQGLITSASLIYVDANNFAARHCSFDFCAASAIQMTGNTVACQVEHCFGMNLVYSRASVPAPIGGLHILGTDHYITNNEFNCASGQTGTVSANAYVCSIYLGGANHFVTNNIGEFGETGIYVACTKSRFTGNRADRCMGHGWVITGSLNVFAANQAIECSTTTANTYDGFRVTGNLNRFSACGVPFLGVSTLRYGWYDGTASATQKNEYIGCSCEENCGTAKFFNNYNGGGFFFGAGWYQFNSGTSLDVSGMNKVYFNYSAPATVTVLSGGVSGQTLTFLSNASTVTLQANANIKTVSGANLAMAAQTIYEFTYWNGTWYQHS